jgi:glycogen debranching enzyme
VESAFWIESEGFYAQALDGGKRRVEALSSNPGHLLAAGLPSPERAERVIARFRQPDFDSGWGFRTLSATAATYNPMSYHNGSVWPHDNSLIGAGIYRYGEIETGHALTGALFDAATDDPLLRLPELYCGFARAAGRAQDSPVGYPVSCSPQAWAAGSLPLLLRSMLGLEVDLANRTLVVRPSLPDWLSSVLIEDLRVLGVSGQLVVSRGVDSYEVETEGLPLLAQV